MHLALSSAELNKCSAQLKLQKMAQSQISAPPLLNWLETKKAPMTLLELPCTSLIAQATPFQQMHCKASKCVGGGIFPALTQRCLYGPWEFGYSPSRPWVSFLTARSAARNLWIPSQWSGLCSSPTLLPHTHNFSCSKLRDTDMWPLRLKFVRQSASPACSVTPGQTSCAF